jgi:hypothetical protein
MRHTTYDIRHTIISRGPYQPHTLLTTYDIRLTVLVALRMVQRCCACHQDHEHSSRMLLLQHAGTQGCTVRHTTGTVRRMAYVVWTVWRMMQPRHQGCILRHTIHTPYAVRHTPYDHLKGIPPPYEPRMSPIRSIRHTVPVVWHMVQPCLTHQAHASRLTLKLYRAALY